jgi:hypothetical protein
MYQAREFFGLFGTFFKLGSPILPELPPIIKYRVAAIFSEYFQSLTVTLKNHIFY